MFIFVSGSIIHNKMQKRNTIGSVIRFFFVVYLHLQRRESDKFFF